MSSGIGSAGKSQLENHMDQIVEFDKEIVVMMQKVIKMQKDNEELVSRVTELWGLGINVDMKTVPELETAGSLLDEMKLSLKMAQIKGVTAMAIFLRVAGKGA